ncbi:acyltransferase domain-containing protein [Pseudoalteromonas sp. OOF1S-7]|uniref:ACP S-malonyltransferase n=1 Tax=Pseudoalteromonas sp. OOF1S-7 TaxID=2917757 RepID=UPI0023B7CA9B|nr:acyltransferase domain-containing protein [Pseudoalteromonas sp. OOF1S-7]MCG7536678.1 acyltransferase domain-containing protein [Pseudoalteromonas sp. OOF1S-7]
MDKVLFFPGQGSQEVGMGAEMWDTAPEIADIAHEVLGYDLKSLCLHGPAEQLNKTDFAQAAIYTVNHLHLLQWQSSNDEPSAVLGHSIGQYNAMVAASVISFKDGLKLVKKRGELMARQAGGAMCAVMKLNRAEIEAALAAIPASEHIDFANYNSALQTVLSGPAQALEEVAAHLGESGAFVVKLNTSGAFHSKQMAEAKTEFAKFLSQFAFASPLIPLVCNVTAQPINHIATALADHLTHPVCWSDSIGYVFKHFPDAEFVECGHGKTLTNILRYNKKELL